MLADCQTVKREIIKYDFPENKITVFPWGVNLKFFSPDEKSKKKDEVGFKKDFLIIHTRSWEPRYGVDIALRGFKIAAEKIPNLHMIMLGGGSQDKWVKDFIQSSNLSNQVHFYGYQENEKIATFYQAADVYLSASHIDGSSVALMESMACGCPAIVSDIPSNLEWITDRKEGLTFRNGDAIDLARIIVDLAGRYKELNKLGKAARKKVEEFANWENGVQALLKTYQTVRDLYRNTKKG
jgi:glycosyltransferase involved in cell wall biosynthesis